jgi:Domain of unknown function (DUF4337)
MDTIDKEISELKSFIADLKADRAAQKEKEKREAWTKYVSLSIVVIAVLAAIATQWAGKYSSRTLVKLNESTFNQVKASDTWSEYQANSIKQNLYEVSHDLVPKDQSVNETEAAKREEAFKAKTSKYSATKDQKRKEAEDLQAARDAATEAAKKSSERGSDMGFAVAIFQISIAMGSICLVTKKRPLWFISLLLAAFAAWEMVAVWMKP